MMRAIVIRPGTTGPETLQISDSVTRPAARKGEVLVRVKAFGLNRLDLLQRDGHYPPPPGAPDTLGVEFSGVVEAVGGPEESDKEAESTTTFAPGDEVFGLAYGGGYAEFIAVSARTVLHKPTALSWTDAAGIPETWMTALQALHEVAGFQAGQSVLWHAGASGVGIAGIQLSRVAGAGAVYATAGTDAKCGFVVRELGATAAVNYKTGRSTSEAAAPVVAKTAPAAESGLPWPKEVLRLAPAGVDVIIDFVGASYFAANLNVAAREGHIVLLAFLGGALLPPNTNLAPLLIKRLRIEGSSLRSRDTVYQGRLRDRLAALLPLFSAGQLRLFTDRVFSWTDIREAHQYMESNSSMGKIICTVD